MSEYGEEHEVIFMRDGEIITEMQQYKTCNGCRQRDKSKTSKTPT